MSESPERTRVQRLAFAGRSIAIERQLRSFGPVRGASPIHLARLLVARSVTSALVKRLQGRRGE